jgi:hypothetical protein
LLPSVWLSTSSCVIGIFGRQHWVRYTWLTSHSLLILSFRIRSSIAWVGRLPLCINGKLWISDLSQQWCDRWFPQIVGWFDSDFWSQLTAHSTSFPTTHCWFSHCSAFYWHSFPTEKSFACVFLSLWGVLLASLRVIWWLRFCPITHFSVQLFRSSEVHCFCWDCPSHSRTSNFCFLTMFAFSIRTLLWFAL